MSSDYTGEPPYGFDYSDLMYAKWEREQNKKARLERGDKAIVMKGFYKGRTGHIAAVHENTVWLKTKDWLLRLPKTLVEFNGVGHAVELPNIEIDVCNCPTDTRHALYPCSKCGFLEETFTFIPLNESDAERLRMTFDCVCHYCAARRGE